jgi:capsular exopolysaccharide synthesis family protein
VATTAKEAMTALSRSMDETVPEGTVDLHAFLATIIRRKWLVLGVAQIAIVLAALYSFNRTPIYTAQADVLVRPVLTNPLEGNPLEQISLQTEIRIVTSSAVAELVRRTMGPDYTAEELLGGVSVSAPQETQILEISFSDPSARQAERAAQAFAEAYLEFKSGQAIESISRQTSSLQKQIDLLNEEISLINLDIASLPRRSAAWADAVDRRSAIATTRLSLQNQLATLSTLSVDPGQVIQPALLPSSPSSPKHRLDLLLGLFIGLVVGAGLASVMERSRDRIENHGVLEQILEAPVLGMIPRFSFSYSRRSTQPVAVGAPRSVAAEAFRTLRTNLLAVTARPPVTTLLITSARAGEGKSTIASNLAAVLAELGKDVVLISADLRAPQIHTYFGLDNDRGLGQVLSDGIALEDALCDSPIPHLRILPSGPVTDINEPAGLMQSDRMEDVLARCAAAGFVIIDGPPILAVADSLVLATMVDAVLFVTDIENGRRAATAQSRDQLAQVGARVVGGVVNGGAMWKSPRSYGEREYRPRTWPRTNTPDAPTSPSTTPELQRRTPG